MVLSLVLPIVISGGDAVAQRVPFDADRLEQWLKSDRIKDLRSAHIMIRQHRQASKVFLKTVEARANHPELAAIAATIKGQSSSHPSGQPSSLSPSIVSPSGGMSSGAVPPDASSASGVLASPRPTMSIEELRQKSIQPGGLGQQEWKFLFDELDSPFDPRNIQHSRHRNDVINLIRSKRDESDPVARVRLFDESVKHPERLIDCLFKPLAKEPKLLNRVYALTTSSDEQAAITATRSLAQLLNRIPPDGSQRDIVLRLLARREPREAVDDACDEALSMLSRFTPPDSQQRIRTRLVSKVGKTSTSSDTVNYRPSLSTRRALLVTQSISDIERKQIAAEVKNQFNGSHDLLQLTHFLLGLNVPLAGMQPTFRKLVSTSVGIESKTLYAKALYRAGDHGRDVLSVFQKAINSPSFVNRHYDVLNNMKELGPDAAPLLPKLLQLLEAGHVQPIPVVEVIGSMGARAKPAVPKFTMMLHEPEKLRPSLLRALIVALGDIGPRAKEALPEFGKLLDTNDLHLIQITIDAYSKMAANDPASIDGLQTIAKSTDRATVGWYASLAFEKLRRDLQASDASRPANGSQPRFVDHGVYVEDTQTGLLWQKNGAVPKPLSQTDAEQYAKQLTLGNKTNWRLPKAHEIASIFPADQPPFVDPKVSSRHQAATYWTSEREADEATERVFVARWYGDGGISRYYARSTSAYVRCVHDPATKK